MNHSCKFLRFPLCERASCFSIIMKFKKRSLWTAGEEVSQLQDRIFALNQKIQNIQHNVDKQLQHSKRGISEINLGNVIENV